MNPDVSDKMLSKTLATVYYTPINEPDNIKTIMVETEKDYELVKGFIVKNTKRRRNPTLEPFQSSGLSEIGVIKKIKEDFPSIKHADIKHLFDTLSIWMYTSAKSKEKYFALLINHDFIFIYHFKPEKSITFKDTEIEEFVKYLDSSTINWFVFLTNKEVLKEYYDIAEEKDSELGSNEEIIYCYEKQATKGFEELVSKEPTYDCRGEIKVRGDYDSDTDLVVETHLEHLSKLKDSLSVSIENSRIEINGLSINIKEIQIDDKKYDCKDKDLIFSHIFYNSLNIAQFISNFDFYLNKYLPAEVTEEMGRIVITKDGSVIKTIDKPNKKFNEKTTLYILGKNQNGLSNNAFLDYIRDSFEKQSTLSLVEISKFNEKYHVLNINDITLFLKFGKLDEATKISETISKLTKNLDGQYNQFYKKFLSLVGLMQIESHIKNKKIANEIYTSSKLAMANLLAELSQQQHSMTLREIDRLGIEFKAGKLANGEGFFDPSPEKFANKLIEKTKSKRLDLIIYLIGINEDTKDFSPVPLSRIRNEFRESVKEKIEMNGFKVDLIESLPLDEEQGILLIVLNK
ncbi:MAG: hypothetical protein PHH85_12505 [Candidatus Methanoperedens sp.]|nr:hypothetical protein [Candidatus Methanoperedens sp.]